MTLRANQPPPLWTAISSLSPDGYVGVTLIHQDFFAAHAHRMKSGDNSFYSNSEHISGSWSAVIAMAVTCMCEMHFTNLNINDWAVFAPADLLGDIEAAMPHVIDAIAATITTIDHVVDNENDTSADYEIAEAFTPRHHS